MNGLEIKKFRKDYRLKQDQLANMVGVSVSAVRSWEQNKRNITQSAIKLIKAYEDEMLKKRDIDTDSTESDTQKNRIPFYDDIITVGGFNETVADLQPVKEPSEYIDTGDWFKEATAAIRHYGESMTEYPPGCILALKELKERHLVVWGRDYLIETNEYRVTKRVQRGKNDEYIKARSTNSETYPDGQLIHEHLDIAWSDISRIFLVLGYVVKKNEGTMVYSSQNK